MEEEKNVLEFKEDTKEPSLMEGRLDTKKKKEKDNLKMFLFGFVGLLGLALIVSGAVGIYRVYAKTATDSFTMTVARVLRLPAMKVNGERVLYKDYIEYLQALKLSVVGAGQNTLTDEQISDRVLWWQTNNILTTAAAKSMGITVEPADIKQLEDGLIQQFKTLEAANAELEKRYGWSLKEYEDKIMSTMILQNKLNEKVSLDQKAREEVRNQAEQILDQIKKGADFAEMAKKYGEDGTAGQGGSLGWFGKGDMVPEFEAVAFTLKKGEVSPNLVETEFGYHIIKVDDKKVEKVKDSKGKMVNTEKVDARHILFRFPSVDKYLDTLSKQMQVNLYLHVHNPFTDSASQPQ